MNELPNARDLFGGVRIEVSKHLVGSKVAFQIGDGPVVVSPAMFDLISHASPEELETLLKTILLKRLPSFKLDFSQPLMMTTKPYRGA